MKPHKTTHTTPNFSHRNCPLCHSTAAIPVIDIPVKTFCDTNFAYVKEGYKKLGFSGEETFPLVRCNYCGFVRAAFLPDGNFLNEVYEELIDPAICKRYSLSNEVQAANQTLFENSLSFLNQIRNQEKERQPEEIKILDYGAGWGGYLDIARSRGAQTFAFEISRSRSQFLASRGVNVLETIQQLETFAPYDIIHCNQVLEHVPDPSQTVALFHQLLSDNGLLYISVPNYRDDKLYQQITLIKENNPPKEINPWEHLNYFSPGNLNALATSHGFTPLEEGETTNLYCRKGKISPFHIIKKKQVKEDLTVCLFTVGEPLLEKCLEALEAQTLKPKYIETIKNVAPLDRAFAQGFSRVKTKYYVSLDADMVLFPYALWFLYSKILTAPDAFEAIARLEDPFMGQIEGIRIYNHPLVEQMGGFPDSCGPERRLMTEAKRFKYKRLYYYDTVGLHHPQYTVDEIFWKFKRETERIRLHDGGDLRYWRDGLQSLARKYLAQPDDVSIAALAGYFHGIGTENKALFKEIDFREYDQSPYLDSLTRFLNNRRFYSSTAMNRAPIYQQKEEMDRLSAFIAQNHIRDALVYGASNTGFMLEAVLEKYFDVNVTAFIDGDPRKINNQVGNKSVFSLKEIPRLTHDAIFIGVSDIHQDAVETRLLAHGIDKKRIFKLYSIEND